MASLNSAPVGIFGKIFGLVPDVREDSPFFPPATLLSGVNDPLILEELADEGSPELCLEL